MGYEQPSWLLRPENGQHHIPTAELPVLSRLTDYTFLERLLLCNEETLYDLTLNRFARILNRPSLLLGFEDIHSTFIEDVQAMSGNERASLSRLHRPLLSEENYRTFFLPSSSIKVCPICLEELEAYDRLYWKTRFLVTCPQHAILLRGSCPECYAAIPPLRAFPTQCPTCRKGDYRVSPFSLSPYLPEASFLLIGDLLTMKALGVEVTIASSHVSRVQVEKLGSLAPRQYFTLLRSFCRVVRVLSADYLLAFLPPEFHALLVQLQGTRQVSPLQDTRVQIAITHWLFTCWPDHFFAFLDALQLWSFQWHFRQSFEHYLPQLFIEREHHGEFAFLDQAYVYYQSTFSQQKGWDLEHRIQQRLHAFGDIPYNSLRG